MVGQVTLGRRPSRPHSHRVADVRDDLADLTAQEDQGDDRDDRDEGEDQGVLGKALSLGFMQDPRESRAKANDPFHLTSDAGVAPDPEPSEHRGAPPTSPSGTSPTDRYRSASPPAARRRNVTTVSEPSVPGPTSSVPPHAAASAAMSAIPRWPAPWAVAIASGVMPGPSSLTVMSTAAAPARTARAARLPGACHVTVVRARPAIRNAAAATSGGGGLAVSSTSIVTVTSDRRSIRSASQARAGTSAPMSSWTAGRPPP